jgi:hypothetical protein
VTLEEIEQMLLDCQKQMNERAAQLRAEALRLPEVRAMPGAWVRAWLESHGATPKQAENEILRVLPISSCAGRQR